jgi:hypothetical protein
VERISALSLRAAAGSPLITSYVAAYSPTDIYDVDGVLAPSTDLSVVDAMATHADVVTFGLVVLAVVGIASAVVRLRRRQPVRPVIVPVFAALALSIVWSSVVSQFIQAGKLTGTDTVQETVAAHDHEEDDVDETVLIGSDALAGHIIHLREIDLVVTEAQQADSIQLLQATRQATGRYRSVDSAQADGYVDLAGGEAGRDLLYLYDRDFMREGTWVDPGRPQALIYLSRSGGGEPIIVGAAFITPAGDGPRIGGGLTIWFPHQDLCTDEQAGLVAKVARGRICPAGSQPLPWRTEALHVWLFDNPNGSFAGRLTREAAEVARRWRAAV